MFLLSRMREAWLRTGDNERAVLEGLASTGRVITATVVRLLLVPAVMHLLGRRSWWLPEARMRA